MPNLKLSQRAVFQPMLMRNIFPQYPHLHKMGHLALAETLGWPERKVRNVLGGHRRVAWVDIVHIATALNVPIAALVRGMATYTTPDWKEQQDEYLAKLSNLRAAPKDKDYVRNLENLINGRYNTKRHLGN